MAQCGTQDLRSPSPIMSPALGLPPLSLIRNFGKQNTRGISVSLACYWQIGFKPTNHSPLAWIRLEGHTRLSITRKNDGNFGNRGCFVFQSPVSAKRVVMWFPYLMTNCCQYFAHRLKCKGTRSTHFTASTRKFSAEDPASFSNESVCSLLTLPSNYQVLYNYIYARYIFLVWC